MVGAVGHRTQDCGRRPWFAAFLRRAFFFRRRFEDIEPPPGTAYTFANTIVLSSRVFHRTR